jgi:hypothetical protein
MSSLAAKNPSWMSYDVADFVSEERRTFPYVYLSSSATNGSKEYSTSKKLRVSPVTFHSILDLAILQFSP